MSNYKKKKRRNVQPEAQVQAIQPWISPRTGRLVILVVSLGMAALTAWQVTPARGLGEGLLWGAFFGGLIWLIFEGYYRLNRFLRRMR